MIELWARQGLVIFQFTLSVVFIVAVLVVYKQIKYVQTRNIGFDKDNVLYFETEGKVAANVELFLAEIKNIPGVVNASSMLGNIIMEDGPANNLDWQGIKILVYHAAVNYHLLETIGIKMKAGRTFSPDFGTDYRRVILNEATVHAMGLTDPVGKIIKGNGADMEITGVAQNFHFQSLHEEIKPFFFRLEPEAATTVMVKMKAAQEKETINRLQQ